jgi:signal peptidase
MQMDGAKLSGIGTVISFLQTSKGFLLCIVLPLLLFFLYELYRFIIAFINLKNNGKKQLTAAEEELIKQRAIEEYLRQKEEAEKAQKGSQKEVPAENVKDISSDVKN